MKLIKKLATLGMALTLALGAGALVACNDAPEASSPLDNSSVVTPVKKEGFKFKLVDKDGNPVAGYRVQICISGCTMSDPTDANGEVTVVGAEGENAYDIHVVDGSFQEVEFEGATKTPATYSDDVIVLTLK